MAMLLKLVAITLLTGSATAMASDWKAVGFTDEVVAEVDRQSVAKVSTTVRKAWVRYTHTKPQVLNPGFPATYSVGLLLQQVNCQENSLKSIQEVLYADLSQAEQISSTRFKHQEFIDVVPDSVGESVLKFICTSGSKTKAK